MFSRTRLSVGPVLAERFALCHESSSLLGRLNVPSVAGLFDDASRLKGMLGTRQERIYFSSISFAADFARRRRGRVSKAASRPLAN